MDKFKKQNSHDNIFDNLYLNKIKYFLCSFNLILIFFLYNLIFRFRINLKTRFLKIKNHKINCNVVKLIKNLIFVYITKIKL